MTTQPSATPIPDWKLERYLLGELPDVERARIAARLAADPVEAARLAALQADNQATLDTYRSAPMARAIEHKLHAAGGRHAKKNPTRHLAWLVPLAGALVLLFVLARPFFGAPDHPTVEQNDTRTKGGEPILRLDRKTDAGPERLRDGDELAAGATLQISYVAGDFTHGVILSIDGRGKVTRHFSGALETGGVTELEFGYQLDDAPDFERFFLVAAKGAIDVGAVHQAAEALAEDRARTQTGKLRLSKTLAQETLTVRKVDE